MSDLGSMTAGEVARTVTAARAARARRRASRSWTVRVLPPVVVFLIIIGLWYLAAWHYDKGLQLGFLVPYPHEVLSVVFFPAHPSTPLFSTQLVNGLINSTVVALTGLGIAIVIGVVWAVLMSQARWIENSLYPYAVILQCIPILAIAPLIGSIAGFNFNSRVIVTVMISLFPLVSNTLFGLQSVDRAQRELFRLQNASRFTTLVKLQAPAALPSVFVGLRTAAGLSVIGAVVGDQFFQRGTPGLGVLIQVSTARLNGAGGFAAIITASLLGVAVFLLFGWLGRLAVGKWYDFAS
jgi:NitT/TauT family transport system permease protein